MRRIHSTMRRIQALRIRIPNLRIHIPTLRIRIPTLRIPFFRIWYSSLFTTLLLITWALTLITPADLIYQQIRNGRVRDVVSIAAIYLATLLATLFIWTSRLYSSRTTLRAIPRAHVPVAADDVPRKVRRLIEEQWRRSALVAWDARPRALAPEERDMLLHALEPEPVEGSERRRRAWHLRRIHAEKSTFVPVATALKVWGQISHAGWAVEGGIGAATASGGGSDGESMGVSGNVQYWTVISELPNLLEAKAVSLAPTLQPEEKLVEEGDGGDGGYGNEDDEQSELLEDEFLQPDPQSVQLLQRPAGMGFRDYIMYLLSLGVLPPQPQVQDLVDEYEKARFATLALTQSQFTRLMALFSDVLSSMTIDMTNVDIISSH